MHKHKTQQLQKKRLELLYSKYSDVIQNRLNIFGNLREPKEGDERDKLEYDVARLAVQKINKAKHELDVCTGKTFDNAKKELASKQEIYKVKLAEMNYYKTLQKDLNELSEGK